MKKQNKYIFRIVLLVLVLAGTMAGLILWTNWTVNSNVVTVLKTSELIEFGDTQLSQKVVSAKVNKDAVEGVNYIPQDKINFYKAKYTIPKGVILTYDYLVGIDEDIDTDAGQSQMSDADKYVYFPITVNAANTSYGYLQVGQSYQMYGIKTVEDSNDKTSIRMYGKVASNVKMVEILSGSFQGGGSASCTFQIEKEQLNTVVSYVNGGATLYFLDGNINEGSDSETFINNVLASTVYSPEKNNFTLMPEKNDLWQEADKGINVVAGDLTEVDVGGGKYQTVKEGFDFRWRDFLPTAVSVRYYDRTGAEGIYFANYYMNGSSTITPDGKTTIKDADEYFTHKFTYDSLKGIYTLGEWYQTSKAVKRTKTFSDEGYYEITLVREYQKTETGIDGKETPTPQRDEYNFKFFVVKDSSSSGQSMSLHPISYYWDEKNNKAVDCQLEASYDANTKAITAAHSGLAIIEGTSAMNTTMKVNYSNALNYQIAESYLRIENSFAVPYYWSPEDFLNDGIYAQANDSQIKEIVTQLLYIAQDSFFDSVYSRTYNELMKISQKLSSADSPVTLEGRELNFYKNIKKYQRGVVDSCILPALGSSAATPLSADDSVYFDEVNNNILNSLNAEERALYVDMFYNAVANTMTGEAGIFGAISEEAAEQLYNNSWSLGGRSVQIGSDGKPQGALVIVNHYEKPSDIAGSITGKYLTQEWQGNLRKDKFIELPGVRVYVNDSLYADDSN